MPGKEKCRCAWADNSELEKIYHDTEWGRPSYDDTHLFELLNLEGAQAGLSWSTILKKREGYSQCFDGFNAERIVTYNETKKAELSLDARIVRHPKKISAVIDNAKAFLAVQKEFGSFASYCWAFVNDKPVVTGGKNLPIDASNALCKDLKKRGFRFVGPTTVFACRISIIESHPISIIRSHLISTIESHLSFLH